MEITIPESWSEITLEQYMKFFKAIKPYEKTDQYNKKILESAIYYFCGISADVYNKLPEKVFTEISNDMLDLIEKSKSEKLVLSFELFDQKYGFVPSLDEITYGEYVDLTTYSKDTWQNIALIMSILYRPITEQKGDKYSIESYNGTVDARVELFNKKLTMDVIFGGLAFFLSLQQDLLIDTLNYSIENLKKTNQKDTRLTHILEKNGISIQQLQHLQETISSNLTQ
jgi:hypothetical protein